MKKRHPRRANALLIERLGTDIAQNNFPNQSGLQIHSRPIGSSVKAENPDAHSRFSLSRVGLRAPFPSLSFPNTSFRESYEGVNRIAG
jgi:hypothetical protein